MGSTRPLYRARTHLRWVLTLIFLFVCSGCGDSQGEDAEGLAPWCQSDDHNQDAHRCQRSRDHDRGNPDRSLQPLDDYGAPFERPPGEDLQTDLRLMERGRVMRLSAARMSTCKTESVDPVVVAMVGSQAMIQMTETRSVRM